MSNKLVDLEKILPSSKLINCSDCVFSNIEISTQNVKPGDLFIALKGSAKNGHDFIEQAFTQGAVAAVIEDQKYLKGRPGLLVENTRDALPILAAHFYANPSQKMQLIAVTGTNGKTTINWLIYQALLLLGVSSLRIGTLGVESKNNKHEILRSLPGDLTTPDAVFIQRELSVACKEGVSAAVMEASSHAIVQGRVDQLNFDVAIFSNLTRDHLDYHKDMQTYFEAKLGLFQKLQLSQKNKKTAVVNVDDEYGRRIIDFLRKNDLNFLTFGKEKSADFYIEDFWQDTSGSKTIFAFQNNEYTLVSPLIGMHNAENQAAAVLALVALGYPLKAVIDVFAQMPQVPGRLESVGNANIAVYVDYAHTPDALENVLTALRPLAKAKLWCVFGCGGDRDRGKRPLMAKIAANLADEIVVTSDNPRTEDPQSIINDILSSGVTAKIVQADRKKAIFNTINEAKFGDVVLIAGKGHEDYQIIGKEKIHFSDVEVVKESLSSKPSS